MSIYFNHVRIKKFGQKIWNVITLRDRSEILISAILGTSIRTDQTVSGPIGVIVTVVSVPSSPDGERWNCKV